ncbi:type II 3-dehydroquinate dehydratase [Lysobacter sp. MMG2]|uniref:type II 3-dehydroquinate dehydratase n=1 Tax=Lysobacter sp. MMG2 TaxID=2801338 RepID=UPI001C229E08|nr:type II 3-dehydroquinate dehydratase [Lysobacter sp. MMG2]MBU8978036.1 type II 3-dehydroquinate dehydratase [Lysobacter sp. MMG2]
MSIAILTAQHGRSGINGLPREVVSQLAGRASQAGRTIAVRGCRDVAEMVERLRRVDGKGTEFLLLDPGARADDALGAALEEVRIPYIEVHADDVRAHAPSIGRHRLDVVDGYGAQGYLLALSIALEHLGCAECENDVHVGT